jgi:hypothetical protein
MASTPVRRLVAVPGVIVHPQERPSTPVEAVRGLLAGHGRAAHLLSEARHRAIVARESATEAVRAARAGRDTELSHELAVRDSDRHGHWRLHFGPATAAVAALLVACWAAAFALTRSLPWPDRLIIPLAAAGLGGALVWSAVASRERQGEHHVPLLVAAASAATLVALSVLSTTGDLTLRVVESAALGLILVAVCVAVTWMVDHAENWRCARLRRASDRASRYRQAAAATACHDEADAEAALAAWESLVMEECQLAHPGEAGGETWLAECVATARQIATPE